MKKIIWNRQTIYVDVEARRFYLGGDFMEITDKLRPDQVEKMLEMATFKN